MGFKLTNPIPGSPGTPLSDYAGLYVFDGATPQTVNIAPSKLTAFTNASTTKGSITASPSDDSITVNSAGVYMGMAQFSFSGTISAVMQMHLRINAVEQPEGFHRKLGTGGDVGSASFAIFPTSLNAGDVITVYVESDGNNDSITVVDAQLIIYKID